MRLFAVAYGLVAYAIFLATFLYAVGFVGNFGVPKPIDGAAASAGSFADALLVDLLLLGVFAIQHSVMARPGFKARWTRVVSPAIERSTYVLFASLALLLLFWQWRPLPQTVWSVDSAFGIALLDGVFWLGWALVLTSTFLINHFDLFGLKQVWTYRRNRVAPPPEFCTPLFYRVVRHPIYLGFLLAFWATPAMSVGHLVFALATTGYILIGIQLEERDLVEIFGHRYRAYRDRVAMLLPIPRW